jgi:hypothetical protein
MKCEELFNITTIAVVVILVMVEAFCTWVLKSYPPCYGKSINTFVKYFHSILHKEVKVVMVVNVVENSEIMEKR